MPTIGAQGWIKDSLGIQAYCATLPSGEDFWSKLRSADDGGDRFTYRALAMSVRILGLPAWMSKRGDILVLRSYDQGQLGSCVGNAEAKRASHLAALDIWLRLDRERFAGMFSPEWSYYASRVECDMIGRRDGSTGFGAARAAVKRGVLVQGKYGSVDLSRYSVNTCYEFGRGQGIPAEAIAEANKHPCGQYLAVDTAEKAWLCAGAGLPINQCSGYGWENDRDVDGAISQRGRWGHSMCACAGRKTTKNGRKLILIENSWITDGKDDWTDGPYSPSDQPWGSFWADLDAVGNACEEGDSFVDAGFVGDALPPLPSSFTEM